MHVLRRLVALVWLALVPVGGAVMAQDLPKLTGRVFDQADLLPPADEAALTAELADFEARTQQQLVVATVADLGGRDVADYGVRLGRAWGIGTSEQDNGVIFLIAPNERRMRIEVGYGLEPVLTDALSGRIIRDVVTPRFKANDYVGGINAGTDAIMQQIELPPEQARAIAAAAERERDGDRSGAGIFFLAFWLLVLFLVVIPILRGRRRGKRYRRKRSPWGAPVIIWGGGHSSGGWGGGGGFGGGFGGFSGGGGGFGGGGASGGW